MSILFPVPGGFGEIPFSGEEPQMLRLYDSSGVLTGLQDFPLEAKIAGAGFRDGRYFFYGYNVQGIHGSHVYFEWYLDAGKAILAPCPDGSAVYVEPEEEASFIDAAGEEHPLDIETDGSLLQVAWPSGFWFSPQSDRTHLLMNGPHLAGTVRFPHATDAWEAGGLIFALHRRSHLMIVDPSRCALAGRIRLPAGTAMIRNVHCDGQAVLITGILHDPDMIYIAAATLTSGRFEVIGKFPFRHGTCISGDGVVVAVDNGMCYGIRSGKRTAWRD